MKGIFRNKNIMLLIFGRSTSIFGDVMLMTALALHVLKITNSPKAFGTIMAIAYIPRLIFSSFSGAIVDRIPKKKLMILLDFARGVALIGILIFNNYSLPIIYLVILTFAIADTFFIPASVSVIPKIVPLEDRKDVNSIDQTIDNSLNVISPLIASALYVSGGLFVIVLVDAITFIVSAISEMLLTFDDTISEKKGKIAKDMLSVFKLLKEDIRVGSLVVNGALTHLFLIPFIEVGIISLLLVTFKSPEIHYGIVRATISVATILAGFLAFAIKDKDVSKNINIGILGILTSVFFFAIVIFTPVVDLMSRSVNLPVIYLSMACFVMFLSFGFYAVFFRTFYQTEVPENMLGRFISVFIIFISLSRIIGMYVYGILFESYPVWIPILILGVGMLLKLIVHIPFLKEEQRINRGNIDLNI
ncbi:MFS transporter [Wukongibacter baidiensis]|uniref:MFS transporter n=1 Tax=Wukongibacter baidiensis TaxID=1723361 RepID=UPI003D8000DF